MDRGSRFLELIPSVVESVSLSSSKVLSVVSILILEKTSISYTGRRSTCYSRQETAFRYIQLFTRGIREKQLNSEIG